MNRLRSWFKFNMPERRFHQLSYRFADLAVLLNSLDDRRRVLQRDISLLGNDTDECRVCPGRCCRGDYCHFTVIDYLIRMFSDRPVPGYGGIWKPDPLIDIVLGKGAPVSRAAGGPLLDTKCPELGDTGCRLEAADRPIRCILWTCRAFRESLPPATLESMSKLTEELGSLSEQAIVLFSKHGRFSGR